jgi:TRAP-type uncharacterized transport system substrate-binding protein
MKRVLFLYYSHSGHTEKMILAAAEGVREAGSEAIVRKTLDARREDLVNCDAVIMGTGNYFQKESGMFRDYWDRYDYDWLKMKKEIGIKPYAWVVSAGVGGDACIATVDNLMKQLNFRRVFPTVVAFEDPTTDDLVNCRKLGRQMAELAPAADYVDLDPPKKSGRWKWPPKMRVIAWKGIGAEVAHGWGDPLAQEVGSKLIVTSDESASNCFRHIKAGRFHYTTGARVETGQMLTAEGEYADREGGPFPVCAVWAQSKNNAGFMVRGDSPIKEIYDVKPGTRLASLAGNPASRNIVEGLLAWAKVSPANIKWIEHKSYADTVRSVIEGRTDLAFAMPLSPVVAEAEKQSGGIRWLEMNAEKDPEGAKRFHEVDPMEGFGVMFVGVPSCIGKWGIVGTHLMLAHRDTDRILVYRTVSWLHRHYDVIKDRHEKLKWANLETVLAELKQTFLPVHEGLRQTLKEEGVWTNALEERSQANAALVDRYCEAYQECIDTADERGIPVRAENPAWVDLWEGYKKEKALPPLRPFEGL